MSPYTCSFVIAGYIMYNRGQVGLVENEGQSRHGSEGCVRANMSPYTCSVVIAGYSM